MPISRPNTSLRSLLATACLIVASGVLAACDPAAPQGEAPPPEAAAALVTLAFEAPVVFEEDRLLSFTSELAQDPHLGRLAVSRGGALPVLDGEFVFGSVDEYLAWRAQEGTQSLMQTLETATPDSLGFAPDLSVRRPVLYRKAAGRVDPAGGEGGRSVESVSCNEDCTRIDITYRTRGNEAGGGGTGEGVGDAGDIDAVTLICTPGMTGMVDECTASN